jgi:hypothetical protein
LPVQQATKIQLAINMKAAKALGLVLTGSVAELKKQSKGGLAAFHCHTTGRTGPCPAVRFPNIKEEAPQPTGPSHAASGMKRARWRTISLRIREMDLVADLQHVNSIWIGKRGGSRHVPALPPAGDELG